MNGQCSIVMLVYHRVWFQGSGEPASAAARATPQDPQAPAPAGHMAPMAAAGVDGASLMTCGPRGTEDLRGLCEAVRFGVG